VVPPGRELTSFEQLVYPFQLSLWLSILMFFLLGMLAALMITKKSKRLQDFVYGSGVTSPIFNILQIHFTGQQNILPKRNFARHLLMMLMIYSLIFRTLYQASYFNLLRSNPYQKEVQSFDEMIEKDFSVYSIVTYLDTMRASKIAGEKLRFIPGIVLT
jgi:hypothetical protein